MSETEIQEFLSREHMEAAQVEAAKVLAAAQVEGASVIASAKINSQLWKWVSMSILAVLVSVVTTYFATAREYVMKEDFKELKALVTKNAEQLNQLIGKVDVHLSDKPK